MDDRFQLSADEKGLRVRAAEIARQYRDDETPLSAERLRTIFAELKPLGYLGSTLPLAAGGAGISPIAFGALVEGLCPQLTFLGNHSVQRYLHEFGTAEQQARFLPGLLSGEGIGAIAITERHAGSDLSRIATTARRSATGYVLDGEKAWVTHGLYATIMIVVAKSDSVDGALTRFIVELPAAGVETAALDTVGLRHITFANVTFRGCEVPAANRLGADGSGSAGTKRAFPFARALVALQALRLADVALDDMLAFARTRALFGRTLAEFHLLQSELADARARIDGARLLAYQTLASIDRVDASAGAAAVKAYACRTALDVIAWTLETLGAAALGEPHRLNTLLGDARMLAVADGPAVVNRLIAGRSLARGV